MWFLLFLFIAHVEPVITQGENRLILRDGNGENPCEGYVQIYHDGKRGYVGDNGWNGTTEEVVCKSAHCGKPVKTVDVPRTTDDPVWLNELKCDGNKKNLWDCDFPGWNISVYHKKTVKKITCTDKINITLDGYQCAGAVRFTTSTDEGYFCDNWGEKEADFLCESLKCGKLKEIVNEEWTGWKSFKDSKKKKMSLSCSGIDDVKHLWQCAKPGECRKPASVICTKYERLQLTGDPSNACSGQLQKEVNGKWHNSNNTDHDVCKKMNCGAVLNQTDNNVTCTDKIKVVLKNKNERSCYGVVHIKNNSLDQPVCANGWTKENAQVVCRELNCGNVVNVKTQPGPLGIMDNVKCSGSESSLWHCRAKRDKTPFTCDSNAYVVCGGSIEVRLADGPGKCAGRVEIKYEDEWQKASKRNWKGSSSDVVCKQLNCGNIRNSNSADKVSKGSSKFLAQAINCKGEASSISECFEGIPQRAEDEPVGITCEKHKVVFLGGDKACSGEVRIEHGTKTYWLSGSNETWNQSSANAVCQQMHCGKATDYFSYSIESKKVKKEEVWNESYNCSPNTTSLFECDNRTLPSDHSDTIASVICSGKIKVNLTNKCWGRVNVCMNETCGAVCADTWTDNMSLMLCKDLGCGDKILPSIETRERSNVIFQSVHTTKQATKLNHCNFVRSAENDQSCNQNPAYVVCSGSVKAQMSSRDKCSGNVMVHYDGKLRPVCKDALEDEKTKNTICEELNCGQALNTTDYFGPPSKGHVISQINCPANRKGSLTACNISSERSSCKLGGLKCKGWSKMELQGNKSCSGNVFVYSDKKITALPPENWKDTMGEKFCEDLKCGKFKSNKTDRSQQLSIECEGEPTISLSGKCHGEVKINETEVCDTYWDDSHSMLVCQDQKCGNAVIKSVKSPNPAKEYYHVRCENHHYKLGQCNRYKERCKGNLVSVYCTENVKFNTTEKCGGQIEVNYRDKWEKVCQLDPSFTNTFKDKLCENLKCGVHDPKKKDSINKPEKVTLETQLRCTENHMDIKYCVTHERCASFIPAEIYCKGYVSKPPPTPPPPPPPVVPIILGVAFLLVLVIVIVVFIRICMVRKAKNASARMLSRQEVEFESGDYEDVKSKENEMEDFHRGRFTSDAEAITDSDARSNASFSYDDIDEAGEARPLTSQAATAGPTDEVTYEVEDPQENYDDIEASPEITQTKVEVHDGPQTTPESVAAATPALTQQDEDYLVPGQDG